MRFFFVFLWLTLGCAGLVSAQIACKNPDSCTPSVAALIRPGGVCTSFLVQNQVVAANDHCLPPEMRKKGAACEGLQIVFPKTKLFQQEFIPCERVLDVSLNRNAVMAPDYVFLKLKNKTLRPNFQLMRTGFQDQQSYTIWSFFFNSTGGSLESQTCKASFTSLNNPYATSPKSSLFHLISCPSVRGNSGSPVLNSSNQVVGIVSAIESAETMKVPTTSGTNLACLHAPDLGFRGSLPDTCENEFTDLKRNELRNKMRRKVLDPLVQKVKKQVQMALPEINRSLSRSFQYDIDHESKTVDGFHQTLSQSWIIVPTCVRRNFSELIQMTSRSYEVRRWSISEVINEYGQLSAEANEIPESITFSSQDWKAQPLILNITRVFGGDKKQFSEKKITLQDCVY